MPKARDLMTSGAECVGENEPLATTTCATTRTARVRSLMRCDMPTSGL